MSEIEIFNKLKEILSTVVPNKELLDKVTMKTNLNEEFHFDSISMLMMGISIEREFDIEISSVDLSKFVLVEDFVKYIKENYEE